MGFFDVRTLQRGRLNDLDPVGVRILNKGQRFHAAVSQTLLEVHAQGFKALAGGDDIRYRDADMAETTRVSVAVVVSKIGIVFGAVVVSQLQDTWDRLHPHGTGSIVSRDHGFINQRQKVQAEFGFGEVTFFNQRETQDAGLEIEGFLDVFDAQHGVVENELLGSAIRLCDNARDVVQFLQAHEPSESDAWVNSRCTNDTECDGLREPRGQQKIVVWGVQRECGEGNWQNSGKKKPAEAGMGR